MVPVVPPAPIQPSKKGPSTGVLIGVVATLVLVIGVLTVIVMSGGNKQEVASPDRSDVLSPESTSDDVDQAETSADTTTPSNVDTTAQPVAETVPTAAETTIAVAPAPTVAPTSPPTVPPLVWEPIIIGYASNGSPINGWRSGSSTSDKVAVIIGGVYSDSTRGTEVGYRVLDTVVPPDVVVYVIPLLNPDGRGRTNYNYVNLNRNFPTNNWRFIAYDSDENFSGDYAESEPETATLARFFADVRPSLVMNLSDATTGSVDENPDVDRPDLLDAASSGLGLPKKSVPCDSCTGTLTTFVNENYGTAFFIGVPPSYDSVRYAEQLIAVVARL